MGAAHQVYRHPYDLGVIANIQSVMGSSPLTWFIPTKSAMDGVHYETYKDMRSHEMVPLGEKDEDLIV
jgi:hypothetical protein